MSYENSFRISVETLENGYKVSVPDFEEIEKKQAASKKAKGAEAVYVGDCNKEYAAKSVKEVMALVKASLEKMPGGEFDSAFDEAMRKK